MTRWQTSAVHFSTPADHTYAAMTRCYYDQWQTSTFHLSTPANHTCAAMTRWQSSVLHLSTLGPHLCWTSTCAALYLSTPVDGISCGGVKGHTFSSVWLAERQVFCWSLRMCEVVGAMARAGVTGMVGPSHTPCREFGRASESQRGAVAG